MAHCRIGLGAMPVAFAGLDVHDVADVDLLLLVLVGDHAGARGHHQDLIAGVRVPTGGAALAEIHDAAVVVLRLAGLDDGLTRPEYRAGPPLDPLGAFHRHIRYVLERDDFHGGLLLALRAERSADR